MKYLTKKWLKKSQLINLIACCTQDLGESYDKLYSKALYKFIKTERESLSKEVLNNLSDEYFKRMFINVLEYRKWVVEGVDKALFLNINHIKRLCLGVCEKNILSALYEYKNNLVKERDVAVEIVEKSNIEAGKNLAIYFDINDFFGQIVYAINFEKERLSIDFGQILLCFRDYLVIENECDIIYRFESQSPYSGLSYLEASELYFEGGKFYLHFLITNITGHEEKTHHYLTLSAKNIYKINKVV